MQPRNGTSVLTLSKATAVPFGHNQIEDRAREERSAYPCTLRRVWLKRHSVLLGLPPAPPPTPPPLPLIAAGRCLAPATELTPRRRELDASARLRTPFTPARKASPRPAALLPVRACRLAAPLSARSCCSDYLQQTEPARKERVTDPNSRFSNSRRKRRPLLPASPEVPTPRRLLVAAPPAP